MKLLLYTPIYPPFSGGAATYFKMLVDDLNQWSSLRFAVLLTRYKGRLFELDGKVLVLRLLAPGLVFQRESSLVRTAVRALLVVCNLFLLSIFFLGARIACFSVAHLHYQILKNAFLIPLLGKRMKVFIDVRGVDEFVPKVLCNGISRFIACSENVKEALVECAPGTASKICSIPVPFTPFTKKELSGPVPEIMAQDKHVRVLFLGDLHSPKGVPELLDAFERRLLPSRFSLYLAGMNRGGRELTDRIRRIQGTTYLGSVGHAEAGRLIQAADIVVLPSKSEGMPRVCLEALSMGKKVVLPFCVPEFHGHLPDWTLKGTSPEEIARTICRVADSQADYGKQYPLAVHGYRSTLKLLRELYSSIMVDTE